MTHFSRRWNERGRPDLMEGKFLATALRNAITRGDADVVSFVMRKNDCRIYRFFIHDVPYYAVVGESNWPYTVYTQEMMRKFKRAQKFKRRNRSRKGWKK